MSQFSVFDSVHLFCFIFKNCDKMKDLKPKSDKLRDFLTLNQAQNVLNQCVNDYQDKPYLIENSTFYNVSKVAAIFGGIMSILAAVLFVSNLILQVISGQNLTESKNGFIIGVCVFLAVFLLGLTEFLKTKLCANVVKTLQKKGTLNILTTLILCVLLVVSMFTSVQGAAELAKMQATIKPENLTNIQVVANDYTEQIKQLQNEIISTKKSGSGYVWNNALTEKGRKRIAELSKQIERLTELRETAKNQAQSTNNQLINSANEKGNYNAKLVMILAFFIELLIICSVIYQEVYKYTVFNELKINESGTTIESKELSKNDIQGARGTSETTVIGFNKGKKSGHEITCKNCNQVKIMKSPLAIFCTPKCKVEYWETLNNRKLNLP